MFRDTFAMLRDDLHYVLFDFHSSGDPGDMEWEDVRRSELAAAGAAGGSTKGGGDPCGGGGGPLSRQLRQYERMLEFALRPGHHLGRRLLHAVFVSKVRLAMDNGDP